MGEASRRKREAQILANTFDGLDKSIVARAVRQVVEAVSPGRGADCLFYAHIGAALLRHIGLDALPVAGSVVWRVGVGDADLIAHAVEVTSPGQMYAPGEGPAAPFHAWIVVGDWLVDFSTWTLVDKARQLDEADGGSTDVRWCPPYVWALRTSSFTFRQVLDSFDAGVYGYVRHPEIEFHVLLDEEEGALRQACESVALVYEGLREGREIRVLGVGGDDLQESSQAHILRRLGPQP